jgi:hypothetical protein
MSRQEALEQAAGVGPDRDARPLARSLPRGLRLAALRIGVARRRRRDQPQGRGREPGSPGGPASRRDWRQFADTRAPCAQPDSEACPCDERLAVVVRVTIAKGRQEGGRGGRAAPGPLPQALGGRAMGQQLASLGAPPLWFGPRLDQVMG